MERAAGGTSEIKRSSVSLFRQGQRMAGLHANRHCHLLSMTVCASMPSHRGHFVLREKEMLSLAGEVCNLEKEPGSRRQVC